MHTEAGGRRAVAAIVVATLSLSATLAYATANLVADTGADAGTFALGLGFMGFGLVGALLIARVPGNRIGWVFAGIGLSSLPSGFQDLAQRLAEAGASPEVLGFGQAIADVSFFTAMFLILVLTPSWFPDGRPISRRWGRWNWLGGAGWFTVATMALFNPAPSILWRVDGTTEWRPAANPIGIDGMPNFEDSALAGIAMLLIGVAAIAAVSSLVVRYRRSGAVPRLQIRWLASSFLLLIPVLVLSFVFEDIFDDGGPGQFVGETLFGLAVMAIPVSAGIAITRYRLYELDRIVRRTVAYAIVAGGLGLVFAVGVVLLPTVLPFENNNLAVAGTTLVVAALFNPVRRRVQRFVDRRFNRARFDPEAVSNELATAIRDQVDPAVISSLWVGSVSSTMQPQRVATWLREPR